MGRRRSLVSDGTRSGRTLQSAITEGRFVLELVITIPIVHRGQGIVRDRSDPDDLRNHSRTAKERLAGGSHRVTIFKLSNSAHDSRPSARCSRPSGAEQRRPTSPSSCLRLKRIAYSPTLDTRPTSSIGVRGLDLIGWEYAPAGFRWCLHPQDAKKKHTAGVRGNQNRKCWPLATPVARTKGAQRGPTPPRPCPLLPFPPTRKEASSRASLCFVAALGQASWD